MTVRERSENGQTTRSDDGCQMRDASDDGSENGQRTVRRRSDERCVITVRTVGERHNGQMTRCDRTTRAGRGGRPSERARADARRASARRGSLGDRARARESACERRRKEARASARARAAFDPPSDRRQPTRFAIASAARACRDHRAGARAARASFAVVPSSRVGALVVVARRRRSSSSRCHVTARSSSALTDRSARSSFRRRVSRGAADRCRRRSRRRRAPSAPADDRGRLSVHSSVDGRASSSSRPSSLVSRGNTTQKARELARRDARALTVSYSSW